VTSNPFDKVLSLRPGNAVARLGARSRLPVLNPRDLLAVLEPDAGLCCIPVFARAGIGGVLRAAREEDAVIGMACPHPQAGRDGPRTFVERVRAIAEEIGHRKPFFLQGGPLIVRSMNAKSMESMSGQVFRYVDAGFTLISLDASSLPVDEAAAAYQGLSQPVVERELGLELATPIEKGRATAESARRLLEAMAARRVPVHLLRLSASSCQIEPAPRETWQLDLKVVQDLVSVALEYGVALSVADESSAPDRVARAWTGAGVRKVEPVEALARIARSAMDEARSSMLTEEAASQGVDPRELLSCFDSGEAGDPRASLRVEALTYSVASDLLGPIGARGSAHKAIDALSRGGRY
jgi:hypothetical protein